MGEEAVVDTPVLRLQVLPHGTDLPVPCYETGGAAGMDVRAAEDATLQPGQTVLVATGFKLAVEHGWEVQLRPRSGLALKHGLTLLNSPGTIDADYRGEVKVILTNLGGEAFEVKRGDRIAQMVVARAPQAKLVVVEELDETARGGGGFGSTGV